MSIDPEGRQLVAGTEGSGTIFVWDTQRLEVRYLGYLGALSGHVQRPVLFLSLARQTNQVKELQGATDCLLTIWPLLPSINLGP